MTSASAASLDVIRDPRLAASLLHPLRVDLLRRLREPLSASALARRVGQPRQRINYHLREMENAGLVEFVEERRRGNSVERVVRATAHAYLISPEALGSLSSTDPDEVRDRFSATYLIALASQAVRDVADLRARAETAGKRLATLALQVDVRFASAARRTAFAEELAEALAQLAAKYHDEHAPGGRRFRFIAGGYPAAPAQTPKPDGGGGDPPRPDDAPPARRPRLPRSKP
jgi:DNA-binding transcriptional ArsR family regulator